MSRPCESFVVTEFAIGTVGNMSGAGKKVNTHPIPLPTYFSNQFKY